MAAALLEHHAGGRVRVRSAGTTPSDEIHPSVIEAIAERGLDVSTAGKPIAEVRPIRDDIERRLLDPLRELAPED
jgi:arsenate reductase